MARTTISVPDDLQEKMKRVVDRVNWSAIAQRVKMAVMTTVMSEQQERDMLANAEPCPFCGTINDELSVEFERFDNDNGFLVVFFVSCLNCDARGPIRLESGCRAVSAWNRRLGV